MDMNRTSSMFRAIFMPSLIVARLLTAVEIATNGQITNSVIDTLEFDTADGYAPAIIPVSGNVYAIAYRGTSADGFLKTVEIATNGQITNSVIDTLEFDTADGNTPDIKI